MNSNEFIEWLIKVCEDNSALCIVRTHLNTSIKTTITHSDLYFIPSDTYPQSEELLLISDIMVCDWSSIAFDYLLLKRPTIFIDIPPPFKNGLSISKDFRYGEVVGTASELVKSISKYINNAHAYMDEHGGRVDAVINEVYDSYPDGKATIRCRDRLINLLG
jgi:CDP-glycerol glycerophosphotransferase